MNLIHFFAQKCPDVEFIDSIGELHLLSDFDDEIEDYLLQHFVPNIINIENDKEKGRRVELLSRNDREGEGGIEGINAVFYI